jgi:hypothetical protein
LREVARCPDDQRLVFSQFGGHWSLVARLIAGSRHCASIPRQNRSGGGCISVEEGGEDLDPSTGKNVT